MITFLKFVALIAILYTIALAFVFIKQRSFIFFPNKNSHSISQNLPDDVIEYQFQYGGETLQGWLVNQRSAKYTLILYYGGNAEDVYYNIDDFKELSGVATLLVNYRGYGSSTGQPSEKNLFQDALAIYDDVKGRYQPETIFPMGRSLGSGVATFLASQRPVKGTILVTPYDSLIHMARRTYPWLPTSLLLRHKFNSLDYVQKIQSPLLVIYGGNDEVIPNKSTENLIQNIPGHKSVFLIEEADHNNISLTPAYWLHIVRFINSPENPQLPQLGKVVKATNKNHEGQNND
jgi:uncharacterized protein